jgi:thiol-disulfide isomerase/thioredoxin
MRTRTQTVVVAVALLVLVQALAFVLYRWRAATLEAGLPTTFETEPLDEGPAPRLELQTSDGKRVDWSAFDGKPLLVHFWASWCTPCRDELPMLLDVSAERADTLHVLAVSLDSDWAPVGLFFDAAIPQQVSRSLDGTAAQRYGVTTLPDTFLVTASGTLLARMRGARSWSSKEARAYLDSVVGARSSRSGP